MRTWTRQRTFLWVPTVVVLAVVLIAGSRMIALSVRHDDAVAHETAATAANASVRKIEPLLQKLADLAERRAALAAQVPSRRDTLASLESLPPVAKTLWMTSDDKVLGSRPAEAATANGIASEWGSADSAHTVPGAAVLGPMRLGSLWLIAVRFPIATSSPMAAARLRGWSVAYTDLDELIGASHLGRLIDMGYDFELSQVEPSSSRSRSFVSSRTEPLTDTVAARIRLPVAAAIPGSYLELAIRPRAGWFPATLLASEIGLLVFLAWLLAFGTYELTHELQRSRADLVAALQRQRSTNQQLAVEMQKRLNLQETFDHARFHDAFTGLPNRRYFMDQLDRALRDLRKQERQCLAVIIVDIVRFKLINDILGHTAGDELMVQAARRFEKTTSAFEGVLARWGGDQFAVLILDLASRDAAMNVASLLRGELRSPFDLRRHRLVVAATMGVTWADSGQQRAEDVVREADIALSAAKHHETAKILGYAPNMAGQAANLVSLEADLHVASERHELQLLFQPIVNLHTYKMVGAEALLRWRHPVEGVLAPDRFLGIAEETGLMVPITHWVILRAVRVAEDWLRRLPANQEFFISVNLSPTALRDPELSQYVASLLRETQLPPSLLKFELTEAALISNVGAARETLDQLHGLGVQLMLDDFGTGYSSLSYLQLFPFDFVKIDRPFVNLMASDQANTGMTAAMLQMAGSLNLTAIAEIVETEEAAQALQAMGCDYAQGYYFSEPVEAEPALQLLRSGQPFQPRPESSATLKIRPLEEDGSPTIRMRIDQVQPAQEASPTTKIRPLEEDGSPTMRLRVDQPSDQPAQETASTLKLHALDEDGSPTIKTRVDQQPDLPAQEPSATVKLRPLDEDGSPTNMLPAAQHHFQASRWTSATAKLRPLDEDGSPTIKTRVDQQPDQSPQEPSATVKRRPLDEDGSPTIEDPIEEPQLKGARRR